MPRQCPPHPPGSARGHGPANGPGRADRHGGPGNEEDDHLTGNMEVFRRWGKGLAQWGP